MRINRDQHDECHDIQDICEEQHSFDIVAIVCDEGSQSCESKKSSDEDQYIKSNNGLYSSRLLKNIDTHKDSIDHRNKPIDEHQ